MIYFFRGSLPWQGIKSATEGEKLKRVMEEKMKEPKVICRGLPNEFATYLKYTRSLRFGGKPDYSYLRKIFRDLFVREGFQYDYDFDWKIQCRKDNSQAAAQGPNIIEDKKLSRTNAFTSGQF